MFVVKLQDYTATEKDQVSLDCELNKDVPVVWYHEEKEIIASKTVLLKSEATRRSLVLRKVELSSKGKYSCDCATDKTVADLTVEGKTEPSRRATASRPSVFTFAFRASSRDQAPSTPLRRGAL